MEQLLGSADAEDQQCAAFSHWIGSANIVQHDSPRVCLNFESHAVSQKRDLDQWEETKQKTQLSAEGQERLLVYACCAARRDIPLQNGQQRKGGFAGKPILRSRPPGLNPLPRFRYQRDPQVGFVCRMKYASPSELQPKPLRCVRVLQNGALGLWQMYWYFLGLLEPAGGQNPMNPHRKLTYLSILCPLEPRADSCGHQIKIREPSLRKLQTIAVKERGLAW